MKAYNHSTRANRPKNKIQNTAEPTCDDAQSTGNSTVGCIPSSTHHQSYPKNCSPALPLKLKSM
uniref:Uncharacterized protein n=1 Tax=Arundo donax TaxID=35708 RepID=A0A0A9DQM1_ARUDO